MKNKNFFLLSLSFIFLCSFMAYQKDTSLRNQLIGQWRNLTISINMITVNNTDKNELWECNESNWEQCVKIKPIRTYFKKDNTFYSEYYTLKDSLFNKQSGKWNLKDSILTFFYETPKKDTMQFILSIKGEVATFKGKIDWDGDGKKDDEYYGTQKRQKQ